MRIALLSIALGWMLQAGLWAQNTEGTCKDLQALSLLEQQQLLAKTQFTASPFTDNYDLKYHRMEWRVDPAVYYISGEITSYFTPREAGFQEINFDLAGAMTVSEVRYHGAAVSFTQHSADNRLQIFLPAAIPNGQLDSVSVAYAGAPGSSGFGAFATSTHNGTPVLWTLSEPYGAREWWPCKQSLTDKIDSIDVYVQTPSAYRAAGNGLLVGEATEGGSTTYHWRHRYAIPAYLVAIAVTNYAVYSDFVPVAGGSPIEVLNYVYPENLASAQSQTVSTIAQMQLFNQLYGLYPFAEEKYGHAQFSWGGGMEHQTMSFMGGFSHSLQAHELAHQWFGDKITCGSWADIWLNEGFATYSEGMTYENGLGPNTWRGWLQGRINQVTESPNGSVWVPDTSSVSRIFSGRLTYSKGALLLHMLRWKLGDENFFQAVRNYLQDPDLAYSYALTADLKGHLEAQSGLSLDEFFADWYYGEGYPSYQVRWQQANNQIYFQLDQTTSNASVSFFEMPVPLLLRGAVQDTVVVLDHQYSGQFFSQSVGFPVQEVVFDPDLWLISRNNVVSNEIINSSEDDLETGGFALYPNPVENEVQITFPEGLELPLNVTLVDALGQTLRQARPSGAQLQWSLADLPQGWYVVRVQWATHTSSARLVKP
jgi:aminopeptidase N